VWGPKESRSGRNRGFHNCWFVEFKGAHISDASRSLSWGLCARGREVMDNKESVRDDVQGATDTVRGHTGNLENNVVIKKSKLPQMTNRAADCVRESQSSAAGLHKRKAPASLPSTMPGSRRSQDDQGQLGMVLGRLEHNDVELRALLSA
jgi:hypothetical protein